MLENFPAYISNEAERHPFPILDELRRSAHHKPKGRSPYSAEVIRYSLLLRYRTPPLKLTSCCKRNSRSLRFHYCKSCSRAVWSPWKLLVCSWKKDWFRLTSYWWLTKCIYSKLLSSTVANLLVLTPKDSYSH